MVKIGLIGCGRWGRRHAETLAKRPGECQFVGIADTNKDVAALAEKLHVHFFENYLELLPLVDAVSIVVPTIRHFRVVQDAFIARKHVLVEKPVSLDSISTRTLVGMAEEHGL